ncbi:o-succinylbenzoate synthase [Carboxylicivirga sp. M1479]|uniref:o-succinylbenzoate synthase n=1 Tax=Carboxylicivirga sp. M1479 TaxID=2594476 RepID=UPI0011779681|nr:o-succinylbenzoate synthase [Carboxylicivirga sp. M1479]TRX63254.1 o-succinylbenzoate synthase [Carboxylicivirga sp. M1479]
MIEAKYIKRDLIFKEAGGTSRGTLYTKPSWFIQLRNEHGKIGIGECSLIPGLSIDDLPSLDDKIKDVCLHINDYIHTYRETLKAFPALQTAIETALLGMGNANAFEIYKSDFTVGIESIVINGLIWMGDAETMLQRIDEKLKQGFTCLKLKVGAIDFDQELSLLSHIRNKYSSEQLELRVDANGAFEPADALNKLNALAEFQLHSIEQPIKAGQINKMKELCRTSPIPIALDEELIEIHSVEDKVKLLDEIRPQYIILKPSLLGGFVAADEWIEVAERNKVKWWATSALESNVGLNAIAQWTYTKNNPLRQGLGTGQVFTNNISSPLILKGEQLYYDSSQKWDSPFE